MRLKEQDQIVQAKAGKGDKRKFGARHDDNGLHRAEIHHTPWQIRPAELRLDLNTVPPDGVELEGEPLCHLAERQDVVIWPLEAA